MRGASTVAYFARRAAQKDRVRILYRRTLKNTLNWAVHHDLFYEDADRLREKFELEVNNHVNVLYEDADRFRKKFEREVNNHVDLFYEDTDRFCEKFKREINNHVDLFYEDADRFRKKFEREVNNHVDLFYEDADRFSKKFEREVNKHVEGEATYNKWWHPDPYIFPWAPGGSKFTRNPVPSSGKTKVFLFSYLKK